MDRYFIELSFKGTNYHGWQSQPNATTVQSVIEDALNTITHENIKTTGAGRTDAGVHAHFFTAHFNSDCHLFKNQKDFIYKVNSILPPDIAIIQIYPVKPDAHARYSAISRTYEYSICQEKDPFELNFSWYYPKQLDIMAMNQAAEILLSYSDFTSFSKLHSQVSTNICHIKSAKWAKQGYKILFTIEADRFLRNMVRAIVGTLLDVGRGKTSNDEIIAILEGKHRSLAGYSVPAHGLTLKMIKYSSHIRI